MILESRPEPPVQYGKLARVVVMPVPEEVDADDEELPLAVVGTLELSNSVYSCFSSSISL